MTVSTEPPAASETAPLVPPRGTALSGHPRLASLVSDGVLGAVHQPVATMVAALVVAMVCLVVLLTTGRSAATEYAVISSIESVGTRLVAVTDSTGGAAIDVRTVAAVAELEGVTWVFGIGPARDAHNATIGRSDTQVPMRPYVGTLPGDMQLVAGRMPMAPHEAVVGVDAARGLGIPDSVGDLDDGSNRVGAVGTISGQGPLSFLNDSVLRVPDPAEEFPVRIVYVLVDDAAQSSEVARAIEAVLVAREPDQVAIETSEGAIALRDVVAGTLGSSGRQLMAGLLGVGLVLVLVTMLGAVAGRRRDFGRRRALGASRSAVVVLVLVQTMVAAVLGAGLGTGAGVLAVRASSGLVPSPEFVAAVGALAILVALAGSVPPALVAAMRDPVRILRVP